MLVVCSPIFVTDTKIIFRYDFVAPLKNLAEHLQMAGSGFCTVLYVSLHNLFYQAQQ